MNKETEDESQHVLETERLIIKDEVIEPVFVGQIKSEPQDNYECSTTEELESFNAIEIDPIPVPVCKTENETAEEECSDYPPISTEIDVTEPQDDVSENESNATPSTEVIGNPETHCHICNKEFRRHSALIGHMKSHFDNIPDYECDVCNKGFRTKIALQKHRDIHFKQFFNCKNCDFTTYSASERFLHRRLCTGLNTVYRCRVCPFETVSVKAKVEHQKLHELQKNKDILYKCRACDFQTQDINAKNAHLRIHGRGVIFKCRKCPFETDDENAKEYHELVAHVSKDSSSMNLQCGICLEKFSEVVVFMEHRKSHSDTDCKECGRILANKSHMIFHRLSHVGEFSKTCQDCGSKFSMTSTLEFHEKFHKQKMNCKCDICGKRFGLPSQMFLHVKEHHKKGNPELRAEVNNLRSRYGNAYHTCKQCGSKTKGIIEHTRHMLGHRDKNDNSVKCRVCGALFKTVLQLVEHRKTHPQMFAK